MKQANKMIESLPFWEDKKVEPQLMVNMRTHAPFIITRAQKRSDLGECIISTYAPNLVCRVHAFRTHNSKKRDKSQMYAKSQTLYNTELARVEWLKQRAQAFRNAEDAINSGITVREVVEGKGLTYDEEIDEPRIIAKVPGQNIYLEVVGFLGYVVIDDSTKEQLWNGDFGIVSTLQRMTMWYDGQYDKDQRRKYATHPDDYQPIKEWYEDYDATVVPWMSKKAGLGFTDVDPLRRLKKLD